MSVRRPVTYWENRISGRAVGHPTVYVETDSDDVHEIEHRVRQDFAERDFGGADIYGASVEIRDKLELRLDLP